jgi:hypothetical protein
VSTSRQDPDSRTMRSIQAGIPSRVPLRTNPVLFSLLQPCEGIMEADWDAAEAWHEARHHGLPQWSDPMSRRWPRLRPWCFSVKYRSQGGRRKHKTIRRSSLCGRPARPAGLSTSSKKG